jgi:hypothetical protein
MREYPWQHQYSSLGLEHAYQVVRDDNRWVKVCRVPERERTLMVHERKESVAVFFVPLSTGWRAWSIAEKTSKRLNGISSEVDQRVLAEIDTTP